MFDSKKLVLEIKSLAEEIRSTKKIARTHRDPDQWASQCALPGLKARATLLCAMRAHTRGRVHRPGSTLEAQEATLRFCRPSYPKPLPSVWSEFEVPLAQAA
jgi:hypothetical protein